MSTLSNYVAKLTTNENIYYVLTGNDFDFNLIDLEHPKLFAISNNYATESVISPVIAMMVSITSRSFSMENKVPFVFILDEMTTFKVRDFEKLPSVLREYGAAFLLLTQSEGKLEKLYSKLDRSSIEANFGNIFLGCTQDVEALKYYPLFFGKYEKEKKSTSSGSSGGGRNSSVTISTQKEEIYESKDFASLEPGEFIGMGNRSNIKGHFRKKFIRLFLSSLPCSPAYLAEYTPGSPPSASTDSPESSAIHGIPLSRQPESAFKNAFSSNVVPVSSTSVRTIPASSAVSTLTPSGESIL